MIKQNTNRMAYAQVRNPKIDRDYYGTPPQYLDAARSVMGGIELDPASCEEANQKFVRADRYFAEEDDGLAQSWESQTLWLNPPYSRRGAYEFAQKFAEEASSIKQAVVLVNSATGTRAFRYLFDNCNALCFLNKRIQFIQTDGRISQQSNSKEQLVFYRGRRATTFGRVFGEMGRVVDING